ncbi:unnamed protein product [Candidula unifasciata]|uniref:Beta-1,3-galactosyl-O-glycosyl-glycoprotein beta-1,6-N-acetylglucosaminyltransferase n=1 Tax=Candidula unifasciata TaxID=100452 RepID=A0A8S3YLS6_9EUPU|nr:unnamed protein product [Candidula unifasciata]
MAATFPARLFWLFVGSMMVIGMLMLNISLASWKNLLSTIHYLPSGLSATSAIRKMEIEEMPEAERLMAIARNVQVAGVNCAAVLKGDKNQTTAALGMTQNVSIPLSNSFYINLTTDCANFQQQRGYIMSSLTKEEEQFPIAYSLIVYKDAEMVERLLRAIYRPHNVYCIHVDYKSPLEFFRTISAIANCFPNVFIASKRVDVTWGTFTVLEPELICMEELWRYRKWKYFINLTGQEFPLKTNYELVKILTVYNGSVDVTTTVKRANPRRWRNTVAPHGLKRVKGSVHIVVNREFVGYILLNDTAKQLLNWTNKTSIPDETYFAMLNANPQLGIKGTYKGIPEPSIKRPFIARFKNWGDLPCAETFVRNICILTTGEYFCNTLGD